MRNGRRARRLAFLVGTLAVVLAHLSSHAGAETWKETWEAFLGRYQDAKAGKGLIVPRAAAGEFREHPRAAVHAAGPSAQERRVLRAFPNGLVYWKENRPHRILLSGDHVVREKSLAGLQRASLEMVSDNADIFGVTPEELALEVRRTSPNLAYLIYGQRHQGLPVEGGRVDFRWTLAGQLVMVGDDLRDLPEMDTRPDLDSTDASRLAAEAVGLVPATADVEETVLVVVPDGQLDQRGDRLAWRLRLRAPRGETGWWRVWVDAHSGEILHVRNLIYHAQADGRVVIDAEPFTPGDQQATYPASYAKIFLQRPSGEPIATGFTDRAGDFAFGEQEETDLLYLTFLEGRYFKIVNESGGSDILPVQEVPAEGTGQDLLSWNDANSEIAARDVYVHANIANDVTKDWDPNWVPAWQLPMPAHVEVAQTCNAFFDGQRIVFYGQGGGCASTGRIADVVYHEYAHGITYSIYSPFDATASMHEGYSDYYGATLTNQSQIGVGFFGPGTILRDVDNDLRWPRDHSDEPHQDGLILAGAFWDLRENVGAEIADHLYHFHRYGLPMTYDEAFLETLILDDDDGNIFNGTPNFDAITGAFLAHGIGDPDVRIQHVPVPDTEETAVDIELSASILSLFGLEPDSLLLYYREEPQSPFNELPLELDPEGGTRSFRATIPGQPEGTLVQYYLFAADTSGHRATAPSGAPDTLFAFLVGRDLVPPVLVPSPLPHATADQDSFPVEIVATDNTARLESVEAQCLRPSDGGLVTSPLQRGEGDLYRGYINPGPLSVGDEVLYRIIATDQAVEPNSTAWPGADGWAAFDIRQGWFTNLELDQGDFSGDGDWAWGVPDEAKGRARSGERVWATRLDAVHSNNSNSTLTTTLDLTGWDRATFEFWHRYDFELGWDGGRLLVSTDGGDSFRRIEPSQGYPHANVFVFGSEGFTGSSNGWRKVEVPLDAYLGRVLELQFQFASDAGVVDRGWMLDDFRLVARQTLGPPLGLSAESGHPDGVPLDWREPRGIVTGLDQFIGYNVYRGTSPGAYGEEPMNDAPLRSSSYFDTDVEPGETYYYVVSALYDEGESGMSLEASGTSFRAVLALGLDALEVSLEEGSVMDTSLSVSNAGLGDLVFETFLTDPGRDLSDVRPLYESGDGTLESPALVGTDPQDASAAPDIAALLAGDNGERLTLRIRDHGPHGDPSSDFTAFFYLDTDLDQSTGFQTTNMGADYLVLAGQLPLLFTNGEFSALVVDGSTLSETYPTVTGIPDELDLSPGADSLGVGFPLSFIGNPSDFAVEVLFLDSAGGFIDASPDTVAASWLSREPRRGAATPESPSVVTLSVDATELPEGIYEGQVLLASNDLSRPEAAIDVNLTVGSGIAGLAFLEFASLLEGMEIVWRPPVQPEVSGFSLYRRRVNEPEESLLAGDLMPDTEGSYRYVDRSARPGEHYEYRFEGILSDGTTVPFGTESQVFDPTAPAVFSVLNPRPSPFRTSVTLRFGIPREGDLYVAVHDVRGRRIQTLLSGNAQPGVYEAVWEGRDSRGNKVASGVYFALIQWQKIKEMKRIILTR